MNTSLSKPEELRKIFIQSDLVQQFVRHQLGCGCPDSVFDHIVVGSPSVFDAVAEQIPELQILVGRKLLISIVDVTLNGIMESFVELWLTQGQRIRDEHNLNRFRLVLICDDTFKKGKNGFSQFCGDDRVHLHLLSRKDLLGLSSV